MVMIDPIWRGETVVILASGPSLTAADVDAVRGRARVIAVNDTVRLAPWADALYSSDRQWWPHHRGYPSFTGPKFGIGSAPGKNNPFRQHPEIQVLKNTGPDGLEREPTGLRHGHNSGYAAINLAVHFGASRILLLGYNLGRRGGKLHFFGEHKGLNNPTDALFMTWRKLFKTLVAPLEAAGVEVLNCTEGTALDCFPCQPLTEALMGAEVLV